MPIELDMFGRIGMLAHSYYPGDVRVRRLAETLSKLNFEVHVVCLRKAERVNGLLEKSFEAVNGVYVHRLPLSRKRGSTLRYLFEYLSTTLLGAWKLAALNQKSSFDVIHVHNMPDILVTSGLIPKLQGARLILDIHDPMAELFESNYHLAESHFIIKLLRVQEMISYKIPDYLLTVSSPMRDCIAQKSRRSKREIIVFHNFPDRSLFSIPRENRQWPYNDNDFVLLYTGTVTEHYRLDLALKAIAGLTERVPGIKLLIVGEGNRVQSVIRLAKELNIANRLHYMKPVSLERIKDIMKHADVGISTHQGGAFGDLYFSNKILEFMTQGLPVISSRTRTIEKYIPQDAIVYFEPENVQDLITKIVWMRENPSTVQEKIRRAEETVEQYMWDKEKHRLVTFYRRLIESRKKEKAFTL